MIFNNTDQELRKEIEEAIVNGYIEAGDDVYGVHEQSIDAIILLFNQELSKATEWVICTVDPTHTTRPIPPKRVSLQKPF